MNRCRSAHEELIEHARACMEERLGEEKLTLGEIAKGLYVSRRQLQRAFAELGSEGFRRELVRMRINRAVRLFYAYPHLSVSQVAGVVGYRHAPFFAKIFRKQVGCAPGEWRRRCRERQESRQSRVGGASPSSRLARRSPAGRRAL